MSAVARVRVNRVWREGEIVEKQRRRGVTMVIWGGNRYFRAANAPFEMFPNVEAWLDWEELSYRSWHDQAIDRGPRGFRIAAFPGRDLVALHQAGALSGDAVKATARHLRSAHDTGYSHGDANLGNFVFDGSVVRAIDFDARHCEGLPIELWAADDLLAFAVDLIGRTADTTLAIAWAKEFLTAYHPSPGVVAALGSFARPRSIAARTLLRARAHGAAEDKLTHALTQLLSTLG